MTTSWNIPTFLPTPSGYLVLLSLHLICVSPRVSHHKVSSHLWSFYLHYRQPSLFCGQRSPLFHSREDVRLCFAHCYILGTHTSCLTGQTIEGEGFGMNLDRDCKSNYLLKTYSIPNAILSILYALSHLMSTVFSKHSKGWTLPVWDDAIKSPREAQMGDTLQRSASTLPFQVWLPFDHALKASVPRHVIRWICLQSSSEPAQERNWFTKRYANCEVTLGSWPLHFHGVQYDTIEKTMVFEADGSEFESCNGTYGCAAVCIMCCLSVLLFLHLQSRNVA